jgi:hypothetical protein
MDGFTALSNHKTATEMALYSSRESNKNIATGSPSPKNSATCCHSYLHHSIQHLVVHTIMPMAGRKGGVWHFLRSCCARVPVQESSCSVSGSGFITLQMQVLMRRSLARITWHSLKVTPGVALFALENNFGSLFVSRALDAWGQKLCRGLACGAKSLVLHECRRHF